MQTHSKNHRYDILRRVYNNVKVRDDMFKKFIERVCRSKYVREVFLVGSRARGNHKPSSDFDIVVVIEEGNPIEVAEHISSLRKEPIPVDIIVIGKEDLEDPIYREMLKDRRKLC